MVSQIHVAMRTYENDAKVNLVIVKGKGKAFCAGGDVTRVVLYILAGHWTFAASFYRRQLMLDYLLATYKKPLVFLINGIVMGGGAGLSMNGMFRIVTENTVFAMPEVLIGHFPDVGASYFLSRLPGYYGEYLGLTGARINGVEMLACGLATHFVLSKDLQQLENALCELVSSDALTISKLINKFIYSGQTNQDNFHERLETINKCFCKETVEEILLSLEEMNSGADKWIVEAISSLKSASPTSLKIGLRSIREGRKQTLELCIAREYIVCSHVVRGTVTNDFFEGARALLFEKDKKPKWEPSQLCRVSEEMLDKFSAELDDEDFKCLQLPARSSPSTEARAKL
ncbi:probable 3-hydroxyisobutyryl-CoA hydrolase 3 isoform X2 [Rhododendron vialii]|nr:probable 3-hydroxyisobutyryl-CoA hydrolase 3 isoform X2 [Rhododendron vialii]